VSGSGCATRSATVASARSSVAGSAGAESDRRTAAGAREGVAALVEGCCAHPRRFAEGLGAAGFEVLNEVFLNQVVVSFGDAARCAEVAARVQAEGVCWLGPPAGRAAMRFA